MLYLEVIIVCDKLDNSIPNVITHKVTSFLNQLQYNFHIPASNIFPQKEDSKTVNSQCYCMLALRNTLLIDVLAVLRTESSWHKSLASISTVKRYSETLCKRKQSYHARFGANFSARIAAFSASSSRMPKSAVVRYCKIGRGNNQYRKNANR